MISAKSLGSLDAVKLPNVLFVSVAYLVDRGVNFLIAITMATLSRILSVEKCPEDFRHSLPPCPLWMLI